MDFWKKVKNLSSLINEYSAVRGVKILFFPGRPNTQAQCLGNIYIYELQGSHQKTFLKFKMHIGSKVSKCD